MWWGGGVFVANSVGEEYLFFRRGPRRATVKVVKQSLFKREGRWVDRLWVEREGVPEAVEFDVTRFYGETDLR